jgi:hypothetical protein
VPTVGTATALTFSTASVTFTAPGAYAGATYTATSSPGGLTGTSASSPITVSGLSENTAYTFTVTATNATGTSGASAASNSITTPSAFTPESGYDSLATVTLSSSASSVTFSGIPSGYKHLQIRGIIKDVTTGAADYDALRIQYNGDTATNYSWHYLKGEGVGSGGVGQASSSSYLWSGTVIRSGTGQTSAFSTSVIDILDYANTSKYKTQRWLNGTEFNALYPWVGLGSGLWQSTSAITSIKMYMDTGVNFAEYSQFALYGVK